MSNSNFIKTYLQLVNDASEQIAFHRFDGNETNTYTWGHVHEQVLKVAA